MGTRLTLVFLILANFLTITWGLDCTTSPDGIYEYSCFYYVSCASGVEVETQCEGNTVFDPDQEACVVPGEGNWPCANVVTCNDLPDGLYPDFGSDCRTYYTCEAGKFLGHNWCPEELVFDVRTVLCDWSFLVPPPCGTAPAT